MKMEYVNVNGYLIPKLENGSITDNTIGKYGMMRARYLDEHRPMERDQMLLDGTLMAWGELTYAKPLTEKQMEDYELKPAPGNLDRVRPSITARLKEGTRGQAPPKEPGQKRSHQNHEER